MQQTLFFRTRLTGLVFTSVLVLSGCLDNDDDVSAEATAADDEVVEMTLSGSVGDGPIVGGTILVYDSNGELVSDKGGRRGSRPRILR